MATGTGTAGVDAASARVVGTGSAAADVLCSINLQARERALRFKALLSRDGTREVIEGVALMVPEEGYRLKGGSGALGHVEIDTNVFLRLVADEAGDWIGWLEVEITDDYSA